MNSFLVAAVLMLFAVFPLAVTAWRGPVIDAVVAYEAVGSIMVMELALLAQGFGRSGEFELPVILAVLMLASALVFVHVLERWL